MATLTPNVGFTQPAINSFGWGGSQNANWGIADAIFGGTRSILALTVSGNVSIGGTITAGSFAGLDGATFLQSSLFNQPNGVPQLNGSGQIPVTLIPGLALLTVPYATVPTFNGSLAAGFKMTLTGDVTGSTFINGTSALICFRIVQDGTGGHAFAWPANCRNAGTVNPAPNSRSIQFFMLDSDGSLDAAAPMMYS